MSLESEKSLPHAAWSEAHARAVAGWTAVCCGLSLSLSLSLSHQRHGTGVPSTGWRFFILALSLPSM